MKLSLKIIFIYSYFIFKIYVVSCLHSLELLVTHLATRWRRGRKDSHCRKITPVLLVGLRKIDSLALRSGDIVTNEVLPRCDFC